MEWTWPESLPSSKKKAIEELVQGRDIANQLRSLLNKSVGDNNKKKAAPTEDLVFENLEVHFFKKLNQTHQILLRL